MQKYERKVKRSTKLAAHEDYLRERQTAAGYQGGLSQLRAFMRSLRPALPVE